MRRAVGDLIIAVVTAPLLPIAQPRAAVTDHDNPVATHGYSIAAMCPASIHAPQWLTAVLRRPCVWCRTAGSRHRRYSVGASAASSSFSAMAIYAVCADWGKGFFAVAFLHFAPLIWGSSTAYCSRTMVAATHLILLLIGLPARFDGNFVEIPEGTFAIEGACAACTAQVLAWQLPPAGRRRAAPRHAAEPMPSWTGGAGLPNCPRQSSIAVLGCICRFTVCIAVS